MLIRRTVGLASSTRSYLKVMGMQSLGDKVLMSAYDSSKHEWASPSQIDFPVAQSMTITAVKTQWQIQVLFFSK